MSGDRRILVGSSTEGLPLARRVADVVADAGLAPQLWTETFPPGRTLLEELERFAAEFHGAILVMTADTQVRRRGAVTSAPAANVVFEYAYLSARLTRRRVAICSFLAAGLPSYLDGVKLITASTARAASEGLSRPTRDEISAWLRGLPRLAPDLPAAVVLHPYSGRWKIDTSFVQWNRTDIRTPDLVYYDGVTQLEIPAGGTHGRGVMYGSTYVELKTAGYTARWDVTNEVHEATVDDEGRLTLGVEIKSRLLAAESGDPPDESWRGDLTKKRFDVVLDPAPDMAKTLLERHGYEKGRTPFHAATGVYRRLG
jgi:Predicted nucleotide-binding protein containing TIR-like domain